MSGGFLLLCLAALAVVAGLASGLVGALIVATPRALARLAPAAQARVLLAAAVTPALAAAGLISAWVVDIHFLGCSAHHCTHDHQAPWPGAVAVLVATGVAARVAWAGARAAIGVARARAARRALDGLATAGPGGCAVLPLAEPQAFVLGFLRPRVYVSRGLLAAAPSVEAVLAHEAAHVRRRDPLRRVCASLALALHLPGIAGALERALARAQELAADAAAAAAVGDPPRVADALVRLARMRATRPLAAVGWHGGGDDLAARVDALLDEQPRPDRPRPVALAAAALALWGATLVAADPLHRGAEWLLRLLDH